jgi:ATP-dependent Clp protease ATP-binding subunit ClpA
VYERFTDRARKVMQLANSQARRLNRGFIDTEHVLLGLIEEGSGVASNVLKNLSIDLSRIRSEVEKLVEEKAVLAQPAARIPQTPRVKKVLDYAVEEGRTLNHNYVGTEHLLLGLLRLEDGVASQVLRRLGLTCLGVREAILNLLGGPIDHKIPKALQPGTVETYTVSDLTPSDAFAVAEGTPDEQIEITDEQIELLRARIRQLDEQKVKFEVAQDFEQAARCRSEADALASLLKLYHGFRA